MNSSDIIIRQFNPKDYDKIMNLWHSTNLPVRPKGRDRRENIDKQISNGTSIILVAELNGKIVGAILGTHDGRKGWINRLAVDTEFRRKNIAKKLLSEVEKWFGENGIEVFTCVIERDNTASVKLFQKLGYEEWDVRYFSKRKSSES